MLRLAFEETRAPLDFWQPKHPGKHDLELGLLWLPIGEERQNTVAFLTLQDEAALDDGAMDTRAASGTSRKDALWILLVSFRVAA